MVIVRLAVAAGDWVSCTVTVNVHEPLSRARPRIAPAAASSHIPGGSVPDDINH
jgi:hypothetical protein